MRLIVILLILAFALPVAAQGKPSPEQCKADPRTPGCERK